MDGKTHAINLRKPKEVSTFDDKDARFQSVRLHPVTIKAAGYPWKQSLYMYKFLSIYKYNVFDNYNVWSAHPEEGLIEGRNVEDSALMSTYLHDIYRNYNT